MRSFLLLSLCLLGAEMLCAQVHSQNMIVPPRLHHGDKVAVVSPGNAASVERLELIDSLLRLRGFEPVIYPTAALPGDSLGRRWPARERAGDLMDAFKDPSIKAIMPTRGGYGAVQMLPYLDAEVVRNNPKWLTGYSDISALHSFMTAAGVVSIHGAMCNTIDSAASLQQRSFDLMEELLTTSRPSDIVINTTPYDRHGTAKGMLLGGNFIVLNNLAQTDWDLFGQAFDRPVILFLEEVSEEMYAVDRMLQRLNQSGVLKNLKGLIFGDFTDYEPDLPYSNIEEMISERLTEMGFPIEGSPIPIVFNFPLGHGPMNLPVVEGLEVILTSTPDSYRLEYPGTPKEVICDD